jgi:hypothetical protein
MRAPLFIIFLAVSSGIGLAVLCALCVAMPDKIASHIRDRHLRSPKWLKKWPLASIVTKDWYPTYLRVVGLGGFICTLLWLRMVLRGFSK